MTDHEMIEKVARAIALSHGGEFDKLSKNHGPGYGLRNMYLNSAKAAITAMREATDQQRNNYHKSAIEFGDSQPVFNDSIWERMIDAILKE